MPLVKAMIRPLAIATALAAGAVVVVACQQDVAAQALGEISAASSAYGLHYVDLGDAAKLAYGRANSDSVSLMLECAKGSKLVEISDIARGDNRRLSLKSAGQRSDFGAELSEGPGAPVLMVTANAGAGALQGFRQTGKIEVSNGALRYNVTATRAEKANVERFFSACDRAV